MQSEVVFGKRRPGGAPAPRPGAPRSTSASYAPAATFSRASASIDIDAVTDADMALAIGPGWEKFAPLWPGVREELRAGTYSPQVSRLISGFFFTLFWLLYRKQWLTAAGFFGLTATIRWLGVPNATFISLGVNVLFAMFGKWWVVRNAALMAAQVRAMGLSESQTRERIARKGGVSWMGLIAAFVLFAIYVGVAFTLGYQRALEHVHAAQAAP